MAMADATIPVAVRFRHSCTDIDKSVEPVPRNPRDWGMGHPYWPLFDLRVRTPRLELRPPDDDLVVELARIAAAGIHDPGATPFLIPFTDQPSPQLERSSLQYLWGTRAEWRPEKWALPLAVLEDGMVVGLQDINAQEFVTLRTVRTGSWLGREHQGRGIGKEMRAAVLHLAFDGLDAAVAYSGAWHDNAGSLAVSRALGYVDNGEVIERRRDQADRMINLQLPREKWHRRDDITMEGLEACLELFGLG
jgi:RimJ/RimL family protein N-acetyltransferase